MESAFTCGAFEWTLVFFVGLLTIIALSFFNVNPFWMILTTGIVIALGSTVCLVLPWLG
jgi:hypothetical protein